MVCELCPSEAVKKYQKKDYENLLSLEIWTGPLTACPGNFVTFEHFKMLAKIAFHCGPFLHVSILTIRVY